MRVFKYSVIITLIITVISGAGYFIIYDISIFSTFLIGIFGSALLVFITSLIGYYIEKNNCLIELYDSANKFIMQVWMNFSADGEKSIFQQRRDAENLMFEYQRYSGARSKLDFFIGKSKISKFIFTKLDPSIAKIYIITNEVRNSFIQYITKNRIEDLGNEDKKSALMAEVHKHTASLTKKSLDCFEKVNEYAMMIKLQHSRPNIAAKGGNNDE